MCVFRNKTTIFPSFLIYGWGSKAQYDSPFFFFSNENFRLPDLKCHTVISRKIQLCFPLDFKAVSGLELLTQNLPLIVESLTLHLAIHADKARNDSQAPSPHSKLNALFSTCATLSQQ